MYTKYLKDFNAKELGSSWNLYFNIPLSPIMEKIVALHDLIFFYLIIIFTITAWLLVVNIFKFNSNNNKVIVELPYAKITEIAWTLGPILILINIIAPSFNLLYAQDELINPFMTIKVVGYQWYWNYEVKLKIFYDFDFNFYNNIKGKFSLAKIPDYLFLESDKIIDNNANFYFKLLKTVSNVNVVANEHTRFIITSNDVIHSWALPSLGVKMDGISGRLNQLTTKIKPGFYFGQCSEICGSHHGFMPITLNSSTINSFDLVYG